MRARRWTGAGALALAAALTTGGLAAPGRASAAPVDPVPADEAAAAKARLRADATAPLATETADGVLAFAGAAVGSVDNPGVDEGSSVAAAARAHLARYGAAFGVDPGTDLVRTRSTRNAAGQDVVRYRQEIDGVPVLGGELAVSLRPDRQLGSILSTASAATRRSAVTVTEATASATARAVVSKVTEGRFRLVSQGT
ncbi:hypothetical protein [Mumia sp. DW29H23]|uniref:hypothetical protein n=1 Tax=Mumia sp. DW29H23 TaxID=3421241 RepID=UPI003D68080F